jgi:DNA-binding MarR family transcriptional regulator
MTPFVTFSDSEITARLSIPMIMDAFWENEYGCEVPPVAREVGSTLMYLVRKFGTVIPHSLLLQAVAEHTDLSESTIAPFIKRAEELGMVTVVIPEADSRQRLYGFNDAQKKKILRATAAPAYASSLAMAQSKVPTNTECAKTPENASYYRHIFTRINATNEAVLNKLATLRRRIAWLIALAIGAAILLQPWAEAFATWSGGKI